MLLETIKNHKNRQLVMFITRYGDVQQIIVTPSEWSSGKGLTGMSIAPQ